MKFLLLLSAPLLALPALDAPGGLLVDLLPATASSQVTSTPAFTWMVLPAAPTSVQAAYRIRVASRADLLATAPDLWDSGLQTSDRSTGVRYGGKPLTPGMSCVWTVELRDGTGKVSPPSAVGAFTVSRDPAVWPRQTLVTTAVAPTALTRRADGTWFADFGRHAFGWLEVTSALAQPAPVQVLLGEALRADGTIDPKPGASIRATQVTQDLPAGSATTRVLLPADKRNTGKQAILLPPELGVIMPFRYAELRGLTEQPTLVQRAVHVPFDEQAADLRASDPTLEAVAALCRYSMKATSFTGLYVDGDRERIPYEADAWINQMTHYNTDRDLATARATYGHLLVHPTWPTEWSQFMILIAWDDWMHTGDTAALERSWNLLTGRFALRQRMRADGLLDTKGMRDIVDWPGTERDGYDMKVTVNTVVNAFHIRVHECLADLARALGKTAEADTYAADARRAREAFHKVLFDSATGRYRDGEGSAHAAQHANFWPLAFGLVPPEHVPSVLAFVKSRGMACSVYGAQFLLEGLIRAGDPNAAIALMADRGERSWWHMIAQGSTVTLEAWSAKAKNNLDWNHAWGAAPGNVLPRYILGVRPAEPGYAVATIAPRLGKLAHLSARIPTIRGTITAAVDNPPGGPQTLRITIPGNMRARIDLGGAVREVGPGEHVVTGP